MNKRITPESDAMIEFTQYAHNSEDKRYQLYVLSGRTYTCEQSFTWTSDATFRARELRAMGLTVKLFNAVLMKWLPIR